MRAIDRVCIQLTLGVAGMLVFPASVRAEQTGPASTQQTGPASTGPASTQQTGPAPGADAAQQQQHGTEATAGASSAAAPQAAGAPQGPTGFLRIEHDYLSGLQVYGLASYPIHGPWGLAAGIYVAETYPSISIGANPTAPSISQSWWSEFDLGPSFTLGPLSLTLEGGIVFDWAAKRAMALNAPQLYTTVDLGPVHFESWLWTILYSPFNTPANDYVHTRNWLVYKFGSVFSAGPELEFNVNVNANEKYGKGGLVSLPVGGRVELAFGANNSLALFLGYQVKEESRGPGNEAAVGRFALVHAL